MNSITKPEMKQLVIAQLRKIADDIESNERGYYDYERKIEEAADGYPQVTLKIVYTPLKGDMN